MRGEPSAKPTKFLIYWQGRWPSSLQVLRWHRAIHMAPSLINPFRPYSSARKVLHQRLQSSSMSSTGGSCLMFSTTLLETLDCTCTLLAFSFSPRDLHSTCLVTAFAHDMLPWLHTVCRVGKMQGTAELLYSLCRWVALQRVQGCTSHPLHTQECTPTCTGYNMMHSKTSVLCSRRPSLQYPI